MEFKGQIVFLFLILGITSFSCNSKDKNVSSESGLTIEHEVVPVQELREIFYNMYLPDEMSRLFEKAGANYDPDIINSADNFPRYQEDFQKAVAIGIYGVDLSYSRLFDQKVTAAGYISTIKILLEKLGFPSSGFEDIYSRLESQISHKDSVAIITSELYKRTDTYLKENGKESMAALIIMGGWVEALYIASKTLEFNPGNMEIMDRIAEQKYSLNSLLSLLNNYQDDIYVTENILLLKRLKRCFDKFDIYYDSEKFHLDTIEKTISTSGYQSGLTPETAVEINHIISEIRTTLVL